MPLTIVFDEGVVLCDTIAQVIDLLDAAKSRALTARYVKSGAVGPLDKPAVAVKPKAA